MKKIAITGGIGSGKSTICNIIELNYPVYNSDFRAAALANTSSSLRKEIEHVFGPNSYWNGIYNKEYIGSIIFKDKEKLELLNKIFSEYVNEDFYKFCELNKKLGESVVFYESALVYEHNKENEFDEVICVYANEDVIYERLRKRNNYTDEQIKNRIKSQLPNSLKLAKSSCVLDTTNGINKEFIESYIKIFTEII